MAAAAARRRWLPPFLLLAQGARALEQEGVELLPLPPTEPALPLKRPLLAASREARWQPSVPRIPRQVVLTSKKASIDELPQAVQANLRENLALDPSLEMRWFDDDACQSYLQEHFGTRIADRLRNETRGSYRGDLCRAAVLFREGGFYIDLDVQLNVPLTELVDNDTTFMTAFTADGAVLNALVAAEPRNAVMAETLRELGRWYAGDSSHYADQEDDKTTNEWMGPITMLRGLRTVLRLNCPDVELEQKREEASWACGGQQLRFYDERELDCMPTLEDGASGFNPECPPARYESDFAGAKFGIFVPGPADGPHELVAWPRFEACQDWGCKGGGWDDSSESTRAAEVPGENGIPQDL